MIHGFKEKLAQGEQWAKEQDGFWRQWFVVTDPTRDEDWSGIDRWFEPKGYKDKFSVQYKGDDEAQKTENLFIEVISNDATGSPGWAIKCAADYLSIYVPVERYFYWFRTSWLKLIVPTWRTQFPIHQSANAGYNTHGICVPRIHVEQSVACLRVYNDGQEPSWHPPPGNDKKFTTKLF